MEVAAAATGNGGGGTESMKERTAFEAALVLDGMRRGAGGSGGGGDGTQSQPDPTMERSRGTGYRSKRRVHLTAIILIS